jgi:Holliday junction resolvase RusA-like endonuclease
MENETQPQSFDLYIECKGHPRPQPRPRFYQGRVISNGDANSQAWKRILVGAVQGAKLAQRWVAPLPDVPLIIRMDFRFSTKDTQRLHTPHTHKPDTDNLAKLAMDVLQQLNIMTDDSCVSTLRISKTWCGERREGVSISIAALPSPATWAKKKSKKKIKDA